MMFLIHGREVCGVGVIANIDDMQTSYKYIQVRDQLRERISDLPVGAMLPPEAQLCEQYDVSRITLRKAVDYLVDAGLLVREQGRGTFKAEPETSFKYRESFVDEIRGFYTDMSLRGFDVGTRVIEQRLEPATVQVARNLGIPTGTMVVAIRRVRSVDGVVNHLVSTYLPGREYADVLDQDLSTGSLYEYLREAHGVRLARSRVVVEVDTADPTTARLLAVSPGDPLLLVSSTVLDETGRPMLCGSSWLLPESSQVEFEVVATAVPDQ